MIPNPTLGCTCLQSSWRDINVCRNFVSTLWNKVKMTSLNFCDLCGEKRVKDVKRELHRILRKKRFNRFTCAICCNTLATKTEFTAIQNNDVVDIDIQRDISKTFHDLKRESSEVEDQDETETSTVEEKKNDEDDEYNPSEESEESGDSDTRSNYSGEVVKKQKRKKASRKTLYSKTNRNLPKQRKIRVPVKNCDLVSEVQNMILEESSESDSLSCKVCKARFRRSVIGIGDFVAHINSHNADQEPILKPYQCPVCPDIFKHRCLLKQHQNIHKDKLQCPHKGCGCQFRIKEKLENHVKKMHSGVRKKKKKPHPEQAVCQICGQVLLYGLQSLRQHLLRHKGVKPHKCSTCKKSFINHATLVRHEVRHTQIKNTMCEICGKKFVDAVDLRTHSITHTDERRFQCDFCPYRAKRPGNLRAHIRNIHTNADPARCRCSICGEVFVSPGACTKHEQKHQNDQGGLSDLAEALLKPYKCPDCGYRATKPCRIRVHQRSHTGEKPCKCTFCGKGFAQKGQCNRHMKICKKRPNIPIEDDWKS